tara:strand:+ start:148 stop:453 length:306 start_codon:yes stop_codon:yes gene_type:complete
MAQYSKTSPYKSTPVNKRANALETLNYIKIPHAQDDVTYSIAPEYSTRPDLLANDLYGDVNLWWVFMNRNPDVLIDPIFDFTTGKTIRLPKQSTLKKVLGL